ncbi:MAG TPA: manganese efflux pump MntP family protein [Bacillota bacterium]|nr:manganese efflux pump MntP family protein [Bacillota bacterium]
MSLFELLLTATGLAMDAFAVSVCKGVTLKEKTTRYAITAGLWFGIFQGLMPAAGYFAGSAFSVLVDSFDHWIAFILLSFIGIKMIVESRKKDCPSNPSFKSAIMFPLAVATSIDALAAGVSFGFLKVDILQASLIIAAVTFVLSFLGVKIGHIFGCRFRSGAELFGGIALIAIGTKILVQSFLC